MTRLKLLRNAAEAVGLAVEITAPGDGYARYSFLPSGDPTAGQIGFASSRMLGWAKGVKQAETWLEGYIQGWHRASLPTSPVNKARV